MSLDVILALLCLFAKPLDKTFIGRIKLLNIAGDVNYADTVAVDALSC